MTINITDPEADALTRRFAQMTGMGLAEAVYTAMREAIERRRGAETPRETATRLRKKHGVKLEKQSSTPLPKQVFDEMWNAH